MEADCADPNLEIAEWWILKLLIIFSIQIWQ